MNKERKITKSNAIVVCDNITKASEINLLVQNFTGDIVIPKRLVLDQDINISCNLYAIGGIVRKSPISEFSININGDFYCYDEIHCNNINVSGYCYSKNIIISRSIKVGEDCVCEEKISAYGCNIIVAGNLECKGVVAKEIRVLGEASITGSISVTNAIKTGY